MHTNHWMIALSLLALGCEPAELTQGLPPELVPGSGQGTTEPIVAQPAPVTLPELTSAPPPLTAQGSYDVSTDLAIGATVPLPEEAEATVQALRVLSTNPAHTLLELAEVAGVPAVAEIRSALPDFLEEKLEQWLNDAILQRTVGDQPVSAQLSALADDVAGLAAHVVLDTTLVIEESEGLRGRHTLDAVIFTPVSSEAVRVPALVSQTVGTDTLEAAQPTREQLALGDHSFGLRLGEYAIEATDLIAARELGGADLRGALGNVIDCRAASENVAAKCLLGVCVGHVEELNTICERGLDLLVEKAHQRMKELDLNAVHFESGEASLLDADGDGAADRLDAGQWQAKVNLGQGEREVAAHFDGERLR